MSLHVAYSPLYGEALAYAAGLQVAHLRKGAADGPRIPYISYLPSVSVLLWEAVGERTPGPEKRLTRDWPSPRCFTTLWKIRVDGPCSWRSSAVSVST
jgi:hypothetical protein